MSEILTITSPQNERIKRIRALHEKKYRSREKLFIAEGLRILTEARQFGHLPQCLIYTQSHINPKALKTLIEACLSAQREVLEVSPAVLAKLSGKDNPQSVLGVYEQNPNQLADLKPEQYSRFVVLEEVRDPGNLGTILRTADATGCGGVVLLGQCCDLFSLEAVRASMGSIFALPIVQTDLELFVQWRQNWAGSRLIGTALQCQAHYRTSGLYPAPSFLLMGNEQKGLSEAARSACDLCVKMPMLGAADSLNLAVATGVMLYEILEQQTSD